MGRVQRLDGATSGVRVLPLSKGIGEGTVQLHPFPHVGFGPRRSLSSLAPRAAGQPQAPFGYPSRTNMGTGRRGFLYCERN
jgi:hypothetical protein